MYASAGDSVERILAQQGAAVKEHCPAIVEVGMEVRVAPLKKRSLRNATAGTSGIVEQPPRYT
jgi:hypothetical protein